MAKKEEHYKNKGTDFSKLAEHIQQYYENDGFSVQSTPVSAQGVVIQVKKGGFLAGVVDANRAFTIAISGEPNDYTIQVGIGKWEEHLVVAAAETLLVSDLFLPVDVGEMVWNKEIESKFFKDLNTFIG